MSSIISSWDHQISPPPPPDIPEEAFTTQIGGKQTPAQFFAEWARRIYSDKLNEQQQPFEPTVSREELKQLVYDDIEALKGPEKPSMESLMNKYSPLTGLSIPRRDEDIHVGTAWDFVSSMMSVASSPKKQQEQQRQPLRRITLIPVEKVKKKEKGKKSRSSNKDEKIKNLRARLNHCKQHSRERSKRSKEYKKTIRLIKTGRGGRRFIQRPGSKTRCYIE